MFRGCVGNNGSKENSNTSSNNAITHYLRYTQKKNNTHIYVHTYTFTYTFTHGTIEKKRTYKTMRFSFSSHSLLLSYCFKGRMRERGREKERRIGKIE